MFADAITQGHLWAADLCFLVAVVAVVVALVASLVNHARADAVTVTVALAAVGLIALGLLLL